jgi:hypothetical protein
VPQCDEVRINGELVDDGEHDHFFINTGESLDEIHCDISPDGRRHVKQLEKPRLLATLATTSHIQKLKFLREGGHFTYSSTLPSRAAPVGSKHEIEVGCRLL